MGSPSLAFGEKESIQIYYAEPWKVGIDTIGMLPKLFPTGGVYAAALKGGVGGTVPVDFVIKPWHDGIDMVILTQTTWFEALNKGHSVPTVAELGPYLAVVNGDVLQKKQTTIVKFLENWQSAWLKTYYPYGVQPPEIDFLKKKYGNFLREKGSIRVIDIVPLTKILIKHIPVKFSPKEALVISKDYYASIGVNVSNLSNAKQGQKYEGRIMDEFSEYLELDKNPCECDLVHVEKPYDKKKTDKTKYCENKDWDIYEVVKR
jgi:hypothetical protein